MNLTREMLEEILQEKVTQELTALQGQVDARMDGLQGQIADVQRKNDARMDGLQGQIAEAQRKTDAEFAKISRTVNAIENFPVPYGRPKTFVKVTEWESVSNPIRRKQGYHG